MDTIRVVLASPSDVQKERDIVLKVVDEINPLLKRELGLGVESRGWEDVSPGVHEGGPQAIIRQALAIPDADLFLAVFANRLGSALPGGRSGTEDEFTEAYRSWLARGKPEIMLYFRQRPVDSQTGTTKGRAGSLQGFRERVAQLNQALWCDYSDSHDFERKVMRALIEYALKQSPRSKTSDRQNPKRWFVKFVADEPGLADVSKRDEVMKALQDESEDRYLRLRETKSLIVEAERKRYDTLTVEGEGYDTFREKFRERRVQRLGSVEVDDVWSLDLSAIDLVQPLYRADSHLLQVLVREGKLTRLGPERGSGIHVELKFERDSPAIWRREARGAVRRHLTEEQKRKCQDTIDAVIEGSETSFVFANPDFPFRHANGGVLPIIQIGDKSYYCLFYRETDPIGWNIANGGSDDSDELIDPRQAILRELREELIMVAPPPGNERYTFFPGDEGAHNRPEYLKALDLWRKEKEKKGEDWPSLDRNRKRDVAAVVRWEEPAPDVITILAGEYGSAEPEDLKDLYVNITAEDGAIEVDRVAVIVAPTDLRLLDGEVYGGQLVNRPIGLFDIKNFKTIQDPGSPTKEFEPDKVFYSGVLTDEPFSDLIEKHLIRQRRLKLVTEEQAATWKRNPKLKLCPITRSMIRRRIQTLATVGRPIPPS